ncbi:hypothetical protein QQF64_010958 [Cirrhinus molitorella]|uniref:Uncharacterized protein n=1 Tax=Cirrhinus molitorella TaxID=172907 RepID=A0ABR3M179_9TELE
MALIYERSATCWCVTDILANHAHAPGEAFLSYAPGDSSGLAISDQGDTGNRHANIRTATDDRGQDVHFWRGTTRF